MRDDIAQAIRQRNLAGAVRLMFERGETKLRWGYAYECELWDYKRDCPPRVGPNSDAGWASIASDVLAFHNQQGGLILFGIEDGSFKFVGATTTLDSKQFNDKMRRYLPDNIWVEYSREFIQDDQRYLGVAMIPPRGPLPARFRAGAPVIGGRRKFEKDGSARREGDSTKLLTPREATEWIQSFRVPTVGNSFEVDDPHYRILKPEYAQFIERKAQGQDIERSLRDRRTAVTSLIGVGGMGKTALATWAVLRAYHEKIFDYIVSVTAKDRELTASGIVGLASGLSSYEHLLDQIAEVLQYQDLHELPIAEKEENVRLLLESGNGLLYVDNLETVDDARIIEFLDELPLGVKAIVTSRRSRVRVAARPIDIKPMTDAEATSFVVMLTRQPVFKHLGRLTDSEALRIGSAWNGIPLAIRWALSRSATAAEAISRAEAAANLGRPGDELLEFSFRRIFDGLTPLEKSILQTLALLQEAIPLEAIVASVESGSADVMDSLDELIADSLAVREFDQMRNDYCFTLLPITRAFVQHDIRSKPGLQAQFHRKLREWFGAVDVKNTEERRLVSELRRGGLADDKPLLDMALGLEREKKFDNAEKLYEQALGRNARSWRAARQYGEFLRHRRRDLSGAIRMYSQAAANAPARGSDRALIFREYGILLKDSGEPDAVDKAIIALREAVAEAPNDRIAASSLAVVLDRKGAYREIIAVLEPHLDVVNPRFVSRAFPILLRAYERTNEMLKAATLKQRMNSTEEF